MSNEIQPTLEVSDSRDHAAGIEDLPAELLSRIFIETMDILDDVKSNASPCAYLSHVCTHWRFVALALQELWSRFLPRPSVQWTQTCLTRSPSVMLDVSIDDRYKNSVEYREATGLVLANWYRVRYFSLDFTVGLEFNGAVGQLSSQSMGLLVVLYDYITKANDCLQTLHLDLALLENTPDVWNPIYLPTDTFTSHYPRLADVRLGNCIIPRRPPTSFFTSTLRALKLYQTKCWDNVDSMIEYLRATPKLEHLSYVFWEDPHDSVIFDCRPSREHEPRCVKLPHLIELHLEGFWIHNMAILNYVSTSSQCRINCGSDNIELDRTNTVPEDVIWWHIKAGAESLKQHFSTATAQGCFYSCVSLSSHCVSGETPCTLDGSLSPACMQATIALPVPTNTSIRIRKAIFVMYADLPIFRRPVALHFEKTIWKHFPGYYEGYATVRELHLVTTRQVDAFISTLHDRGTTLFPALRRIIIEDVNLGRKTKLIRKLVELLCECHAAADVGQFESIALKKCSSATEAFVDELRALLGPQHVEWDHYVDDSVLGKLLEQARQERLAAGEPFRDTESSIYDWDTDWNSQWDSE